MVSFWPDSIWTPEFTDLATVSPSPHRHLDGMAVAAAAAVLTEERAAGHQRGRHGAPASVAACAERADHRPPRQGPLRPRPRQRRDREHRALRIRLRQAGQPVRGGAEGHSAALGQRRPGRLRRAVLSPAPRPPRHRAVRGEASRGSGSAASGPRTLEHRRALRRRVVADGRVDSRATTPKSWPRCGLRRSAPAAIRWRSRRASSRSA